MIRSVGLCGRDVFRALIMNDPEHGQLSHGVHEGLKVHGLHDVGVDSEFIAANQILFFSRRSEHDDWNGLEIWVGFDGAQNLDAIHFGHFEIEEHHDRRAVAAALEPSSAEKIIEGFGAITDGDDLIRQFVGGQSSEGQLDVVGIVLREENVGNWGHDFELTGWW
jgi:hypothetical protein